MPPFRGRGRAPGFLSTALMNRHQKKTTPMALKGFISSFNIDW
jgi:hypothetical protein